MSNQKYIPEEIVSELDSLKAMLKNGSLSTDKSNNFVEKADYEEEYSGKEIDLLQKTFMIEAEKYLRKNHSGEFVMLKDWCVHIVTVDFFIEKGLRGGIRC